MLVLQAFVLQLTFSYILYTCLSRNEQPYTAPSLTYRSCTFGGGARQWRCILGRTLQGRSKRFPLVFRCSHSGCAFKNDNLEFAFIVIALICFVYSKSSLTVTPRYLASFTLYFLKYLT